MVWTVERLNSASYTLTKISQILERGKGHPSTMDHSCPVVRLQFGGSLAYMAGALS